jgi:hypothetical protein
LTLTIDSLDVLWPSETAVVSLILVSRQAIFDSGFESEFIELAPSACLLDRLSVIELRKKLNGASLNRLNDEVFCSGGGVTLPEPKQYNKDNIYKSVSLLSRDG